MTFKTLSAIACLSIAAAAAPSTTYAQSCSESSPTAYNDERPDIIETAVAAGNFKTLAAALKAADLIKPLQGKGPFTVFAPTDEAFARLPKGTVENLLKKKNRADLTGILTYHVVPGMVTAKQVVKLKNAAALNGQRIGIRVDEGVVQVAGVKVITTDIHCANGIIHVVDAVMMPSTKNIVETAAGAGTFNTLVAAVQAAGLVEALKGDGPFTVFAPSDEAFAALPEGTVESLLKPENLDKLQAILKYHVVSGRVYSDQLKNSKVPTLQGSKLEVKVSERGAWIDGAAVTAANIDTTNGVIHVIDKVMLPR